MGEDEPAPFAWEDVALRHHLPEVLRILLGSSSPVVAVPTNVRNKITVRHQADGGALLRLAEILVTWEYAGLSPKGEGRLEIYARVDAVWFAVVVQRDAALGVNLLTTLHRIYARKMASRARRGYLRWRPQEEG